MNLRKKSIYYVAAAISQGSNDRYGKAVAVIGTVRQEVEPNGTSVETREPDVVLKVEKTSLARMELEAALSAAESAVKGDTIVVFSEYVHKGVTLWMEGWARNGWRNKKGDEVKNKDLWQRMLAASSRGTIHWFLDTKEKPMDEVSLSVLMAVADSSGRAYVPEAREEEEEPSFVIPHEPVPVAIPVSYGGW